MSRFRFYSKMHPTSFQSSRISYQMPFQQTLVEYSLCLSLLVDLGNQVHLLQQRNLLKHRSATENEYQKRIQHLYLLQNLYHHGYVLHASVRLCYELFVLLFIKLAKKAKHHHNAENESPSFTPYPIPYSPPQTHVFLSGQGPLPSHSHITQHPIHHLPPDYPGGTSAGKLLFFDRAKKSLEHREVYEEFLKLLNLFSKDIVDVQTLVERAQAFLGDGDLMVEFKDLIGWDDRDKLEKGPPGSIRTAPPELPTALPADCGEGPSYRKLPPSVCPYLFS